MVNIFEKETCTIDMNSTYLLSQNVCEDNE